MDMIEKVARALRKYATGSEDGWVYETGNAYAAIEAMREPNPEMLGAFWRYKNGHHFHDEPPPLDTSDYGAYRAMIGVALKEETPKESGLPAGQQVSTPSV